MKKNWIQNGLIVLVAFMPFHAFLSVWLGSITHHQAIIQAWKEVLLLGLTGLGAVLLAQNVQARDRLRSLPVLLAGAFAAVALVVTLVTRPSLTAIAFGAKTDLEFLVAFVLAVLVSSPRFVRRAIYAVLAAGSVVVAFGLAQFTILPSHFLNHFGYGDTTIQPYLVLDPAVNSLRFASTLGGPNQLGTYLLLPLALAAVVAIRRRRPWWLVLTIAGLPVLVHTYSRAAWVGALAAALVLALALSPRRLRAVLAALFALLGLAAAVATSRLLTLGGNLQYYIFHSSTLWHGARGSDYQHLVSLRAGVNSSLQQPLGHGLGTAGPATFHTGGGVVIENNFLQYSYETGIAGALVFLALLISVIWQLGSRSAKTDLAPAAMAAIVGVSVAALVLPAWTDSTTALVTWICAGAVIGLPPDAGRV